MVATCLKDFTPEPGEFPIIGPDTGPIVLQFTHQAFCCPKCGGSAFGRDATCDIVRCHSNFHGKPNSMSPEEFEKFMATGEQPPSVEPCGWEGAWPDSNAAAGESLGGLRPSTSQDGSPAADAIPANPQPGLPDEAAGNSDDEDDDDYETFLQYAQDELLRADLAVAELSDKLKCAKADQKEAVREYRSLIVQRRWEQPAQQSVAEAQAAAVETPVESLSVSPVADSATSDPAAASTDGSSSPPVIAIEPRNPDWWRTVPVTALVDHGLPAKMAEFYVDAGYSTIGAIEDLRANSISGGLGSLKGVGPVKITKTEDAIVAWLSENRDKAVLAEARGA